MRRVFHRSLENPVENPERNVGFPLPNRFQGPGNDGKPDFPPRNAVENPLETDPSDVTKRSFTRSFQQRTPDRTGMKKPGTSGFRNHKNRETEPRTGAPRTDSLTERTRTAVRSFPKGSLSTVSLRTAPGSARSRFARKSYEISSPNPSGFHGVSKARRRARSDKTGKRSAERNVFRFG